MGSGAPLEPVGTSARLLSLISRRTTTGTFIPEMDGLRFLAILWVVLFHVAILHSPLTPQPLQVVSGAGHYGVELFFVISGFVLALPFASWRLQGGQPVSLKKYFLRRLTRLEPPYLLSLGLYFALKLLTKGASFAELSKHLLASGTYLHNLIYVERSTISVVAWSLEIEVQFYLLAPLLALVFALERRSARVLVLLAMIAASALLAAFTPRNDYPRLFLSLPAFLQFFLIGFLLADEYLARNWRLERTRSYLFDALGMGALAALAVLIDGWYKTSFGQLLGPALCAVLCYCAFKGKLLNRFFTNPWIYSLGGICYTIYLYHSLLLNSATSLNARLSLPGGQIAKILFEVAVSLVLIAVVCPLIFLISEKPFMRPDWPARLRERWRARSGVPEQASRPG